MDLLSDMYIAYGSSSARSRNKFDTNDSVVNSYENLNDTSYLRAGNNPYASSVSQQPEMVTRHDDSVFMFHHQQEDLQHCMIGNKWDKDGNRLIANRTLDKSFIQNYLQSTPFLQYHLLIPCH